MNWSGVGVEDFLKKYPGMGIKPSRNSNLILGGDFEFTAKSHSGPLVTDTYNLKIEIPPNFPKALPKVTELDEKVPRDGKFHTNPNHTLCLGSPLRLKIICRRHPTLNGFSAKSLVPFLYGVSRKLKNPNEDFFMGELDHGAPGLIDDYKELFRLNTDKQVIEALKLVGMRKRVANKKPCPCDCGNRLGKCKKRFLINELRTFAPRSWFRHHLKTLGSSSD